MIHKIERFLIGLWLVSVLFCLFVAPLMGAYWLLGKPIYG